MRCDPWHERLSGPHGSPDFRSDRHALEVARIAFQLGNLASRGLDSLHCAADVLCIHADMVSAMRYTVPQIHAKSAHLSERRLGLEVAVPGDPGGVEELEVDPSLETRTAELSSDVRRRARAAGRAVTNLSYTVGLTDPLLLETREKHASDPPTLWFVAVTNKARLLKICFVDRDGNQNIRTCYQANASELHIYRTLGKPHDF